VILGAGKWEPLRLAGLLFVAGGAVVLAIRGFGVGFGAAIDRALPAGLSGLLAGGIAVVAGLLLLASTARRD